MRRLHRTALCTLLALTWLCTLASPAAATTVEGTADFRAAPVLTPGTYTDTIVTGETLWYAVIYRNSDPFRFEVDLLDVDLDAQPEDGDQLTLEANFRSLTLNSVQSGRVLEGSATVTNGGTNIWYLTVSLSSTGISGVRHELSIDVDGVMTTGFESCDTDDGCTIDEMYQELVTQQEELQQQIDSIEEGGTPADVRAEVEQLQAELAQKEAMLEEQEQLIMAACGGELCTTVPEPSTATSPLMLGIGAVVLVAGLGFLGTSVVRRR